MDGLQTAEKRMNPRVLAAPGLFLAPGAARWPHDGQDASIAVDALLTPERTFLKNACLPPLSVFPHPGNRGTVLLSGPADLLGRTLSEWAGGSDPGRTLGEVLGRGLDASMRRGFRMPLPHGRGLDLTGSTTVMGILNVTPDSFSDGGLHATPDRAVTHAIHMAEAGASILDIGGESTRPGALPVSEDEELSRVVPVLEALRDRTDAVLSIDTSKARVARAALEAGAHMVNDVTALSGDEGMADVVADAGAGVVLMHMQGIPRTMQQDPDYQDVVGEILGHLRAADARARGHGVAPERILIDPGIGFGKQLEHNLTLLRFLPVLRSLGRPLCLGASRKSFLGQVTGVKTPRDRVPASLGIAALAVSMGVEVLRVHDVEETIQVVRTVTAAETGTTAETHPQPAVLDTGGEK